MYILVEKNYTSGYFQVTLGVDHRQAGDVLGGVDAGKVLYVDCSDEKSKFLDNLSLFSTTSFSHMWVSSG